MLSKSQMYHNIRNLEEVVEKCDFKGTADAYSLTLRELIEAYNQNTINYEEYSQHLDKAIKVLKESKCSCTKMKK